jgi:hypothetical protein
MFPAQTVRLWTLASVQRWTSNDRFCGGIVVDSGPSGGSGRSLLVFLFDAFAELFNQVSKIPHVLASVDTDRIVKSFDLSIFLK